MNEQALKQTLAKMFPEKVKHTSILVWTTPINYCCEVRDTELLHLCQQVIYSLTPDQRAGYDRFNLTLNDEWQWHADALAKTLGIEIV